MSDPDELDGCLADVENIEAEQTPDDAIDGVVLFADVDTSDPAVITARAAEWREVFADGV